MDEVELLELGFINTSYVEEGVNFTEFTLTSDNIKIEISGINNVDIYFFDIGWINVPNCKTIKHLIDLIKLFK